MDKIQNKPNSSVQHTPSSESFQVYLSSYCSTLYTNILEKLSYKETAHISNIFIIMFNMLNAYLRFLDSISQCFNKELCYIFASVINVIYIHMNTLQYSLRNANSWHNSGNVSIQFNYSITYYVTETTC
jgi:hypothetical protein